jgi:pimeloyl-ACP methyl ester carboxylesterase
MTRARMIEMGEVRVACTISGQGAPLLLLHGAEGDHRMFDALAAQLAPHFTVIAYDQRDCGETLGPPHPTTLHDLARDARDLLLALGHQKAHVYGSSFGGRVAQVLAHRHPEVVDHLVLGSTWALPDALASLNPQGLAEIQALRAQLPDSADALAAYFLPAAFLEAQPQYKAIFRQARPQSERGQRRAQVVAEQLPLQPAALGMPTLLLAGAIDRVVPPAATMAMARTIPRAQAVLLDGVGHAAAVQAPQHVAREILRFCERAISHDQA